MSSDDTSIDVGALVLTLLRNWWVIVGLIAVGVIVGAVATLAQPDQYTAGASVYIGQATDANGNAIASLNSNSKAAVQLATSQVVAKAVVKRTGMGISAGKLRKQTTVTTPSSTVKTSTSVVNIIVIDVTDTDKERAAVAANALAEELLTRLQTGGDEKSAVLEQQLETNKKEWAAATARSAAAQKALAAIARDGSAAAQATLAAPYMAVIQGAALEQQSLATTIQKSELLLLTTKQVERPRILHDAAAADDPSGPLMGVNVAVGALVGLVIGVLAAFVRQRLAQRRAG